MSERKLSTLGYLLDRLGVTTAVLSRHLHVDASLVSKWRSGSRQITARSPYFEEVVTYLAAQEPLALSAALRSLAPLRAADEIDLLPTLRQMLTDRQFTVPQAYTTRTEALCTAEITLYAKGAGRRHAISAALDIAEAMETPGELLFVESEQSAWLLEDEAYAQTWVLRMLRLLDRGFHAKIAIHFSVAREKFIAFFRLCSPLIFHRNASWFYHQYYDENIYWFSFFILEHAMSVMGMSMGTEQSSTTVFTDTYSILQHRSVVEMVIESCRPIFTCFAPSHTADAARQIRGRGRPEETLFSFLPAPAFIDMDAALVDDILCTNGVAGAAARRCRETGALLQDTIAGKPGGSCGAHIQILQRAEMLHRAETRFVSTSLSLLCGREIVVSPAQYARGLRALAAHVRAGTLSLLLATEEDRIYLPAMNCWCRGASWMLQMDADGFRLCEEPTMVNAASVALEQGWRRVPPHRKDPEAVSAALLALAETLV